MQNKQTEVKSKVRTTYRKRLRLFSNHVSAPKTKYRPSTHTHVMPVITYTAGIIDWNKKEIQDL